MACFSFQLNKNYRFAPTAFGTGLALLGLLLFSGLGYWQIERGYEKQQLLAHFEYRSKLPPLPFQQINQTLTANEYQGVTVKGFYQNKHSLLLDNQFQNHQVGYHVLTPLKISEKQPWLLVDRGWIPLGISRDHLPQIPPIEGLQEITGQISIPKSSLVLSHRVDSNLNWPKVVANIDFKEFSQQWGLKCYPVVLRLAPHAPHGFVREWIIVNMPPARHFAYALQWFSFAVICIILWIAHTLKKIKI